jgi:hypothetical protein
MYGVGDKLVDADGVVFKTLPVWRHDWRCDAIAERRTPTLDGGKPT